MKSVTVGERYLREQDRLRREVRSLQAALRVAGRTTTRGRQLEAQLARRKWLLVRYPAIEVRPRRRATATSAVT